MIERSNPNEGSRQRAVSRRGFVQAAGAMAVAASQGLGQDGSRVYANTLRPIMTSMIYNKSKFMSSGTRNLCITYTSNLNLRKDFSLCSK